MPPSPSTPAFTVPGSVFAQWYTEACFLTRRAQVPLMELQWLLQAWTDLDRLSLALGDFSRRPVIHLNQPWTTIQQAWQRRLQDRVPVQYLVGTVTWRNFSLTVNPSVLIPRPETELIIDILKTLTFPPSAASHWVDLGTGSGAIALGLARLFPHATIHAVDSSQDALAIAQQNAQQNHLTRIQFYCGNWWQPLAKLRGRVQGVVSNPPYIPRIEVQRLQPEVVNHEPLTALDGGKTGLDAIKILVQDSPHYLQPGGLLLMEIMAGQADAVVNLLHQQDRYGDICCHQDLAGIERFVTAYRQQD